MSQVLGLPSTGGSAPHGGSKLPGQQGLFSVPTGIQRLYEYGLYSSARFAGTTNMNGQPTTRLFAYSLGTAGPGYGGVVSSISETNVQVGSLAPGNETYEVTALSLEVWGDANTAVLMGDLRAIMRLGVVVWEFGNTFLQVAPIPMVGAGGGIFGFSADTGTPVTVGNNGNGGLWMYQNVVVAIPATQQFALQVQWGSSGQAGAIALTNATQIRATMFNQARSAIPIA